MNGKTNKFVNLITRELPGTWSLLEQEEFGNGRKQRINYATPNSMILKVLLPYKTPTPDNYTSIQVKKLECVGHVQKRVGLRLRNLKKQEKGVGGKGKLTNNMIDRLHN